MEVNIFIGAQAAGKSSFYKFRFFDTHVRVNLDMLRTRNRERILIEACLRAGQPFVVDNTNATAAHRARYFGLARQRPCLISGYYFQSIAADCLTRNQNRKRDAIPAVSELAIRGTIGQLELPSLNEGFDRLYFVRIVDDRFLVEDWIHEV